MWTIRVHKQNVPHVFNRSIVTAFVARQENCAEYPPIRDLKPKPSLLRQELKDHEKIRNISTVEEKTIGINMPRYYGWPSLVVKDKILPYDFLPFAQTVTKTKIYEVDTLPNIFSNDDCQQFIERIKPQLENSLVFEFKRNRSKGKKINDINNIVEPEQPSNVLAKNVAEQVNRIFLANLAADYPHLFEAQIDFEPRIEGFWNVHGFAATKDDEEIRKKKNVPEEDLKDPVDRWIHYFGQPVIQLRHNLPLSSVPLDSWMVSSAPSTSSEILETTFKEFNVPNYDYDPQIYHKLSCERNHGVSIPGFWPNDNQQFGLLSIHTNEYLEDRPPNFGESEHQEAVHAQAILASFAWLIGQASYQGFTICNEITYPLVNQSIITNGKTWSFYLYQLNTMRFFKSTDDINKPIAPNNICWGTKTTELFHDITNDRIVGWNDDALKNLISCYVNVPKARDHEMCPYLGEEKLVANIDDVKKRVWLHNRHKVLTSNRPRHRLLPEVYDWERIYKIQFNTRQFEARRRFFEVDQDPLNERRLDDHYGAYIQRKYRDGGRRMRKKRFDDKYYPDA